MYFLIFRRVLDALCLFRLLLCSVKVGAFQDDEIPLDADLDAFEDIVVVLDATDVDKFSTYVGVLCLRVWAADGASLEQRLPYGSLLYVSHLLMLL